jgi:hypothetical protein
MSTLRITLRPSLYNVKLELGAIANIYDVTAASGKARKSLRDQVIRDITDIKLDPGQYMVEAILPSGETYYDEVTLSDVNDFKDVIVGSRSPHEWLALQHFVGNTRRKAVRDDSIRARTLTLDHQPLHAHSGLVSIPTKQTVTNADERSNIIRGYFTENKKISALSSGSSLMTAFSDIASVQDVRPALADQNSLVFEFSSPMMSYLPSQYRFQGNYQTTHFVRHYFVAYGDDLVPYYGVLPVPWIQDHNQELPIQALVQLPARSRGLRNAFTVSMTVPDRRVGSVIGYLGTGQIPTAVKLLKTATNMLYDKMVNPIAAAAGAYVMVFAEQSHERDEWHQWVENLMTWFPWLPDGAILHAWLKLSYGNKENDLSIARRSLLEGYRRGLPFYSKGVKMLMDGLTLFANDAEHNDAEIEEALKVIRKVAMNTNMRQPFTTVSLQ